MTVRGRSAPEIVFGRPTMSETTSRNTMRVDVSPPKNMDITNVAAVFSAYLLGDRAASWANRAPFWIEAGHKWQLDTSNDFWLHVRDDEVSLTCRYPGYTPILEAMKVLFMLRYGDPS